MRYFSFSIQYSHNCGIIVYLCCGEKTGELGYFPVLVFMHLGGGENKYVIFFYFLCLALMHLCGGNKRVC